MTPRSSGSDLSAFQLEVAQLFFARSRRLGDPWVLRLLQSENLCHLEIDSRGTAVRSGLGLYGVASLTLPGTRTSIVSRHCYVNAPRDDGIVVTTPTGAPERCSSS
jgi:hypothetical protein